MPRKVDLITVGLAVVVHVGLGLTVSRAGKSPPAPRPKPVLLSFERPPETPPAPPAPAAPAVAAAPVARPPTARRVAMRTPRSAAPRSAAAPAPAAPAERPTAAPSAPAYAVSMTSTTPVAAFAVPRGVPGGSGSGFGAPSGRATAPAGDGAGDGYRPASAREVGSMPEVDADACGRAAIYPREAEQSGIEGDVRLRVSLNERGQVHAVRVLSGLGRGLDAAAIDAIKNRCKFKPAIGHDGQPVAFVIESYKFHFELPR